MTDKIDHISRQKFMEELRRYQKGSVTRRHFLGVTGLGAASAVLGVAMPGLLPRAAFGQTGIGDRVALATWPNYHDVTNFDAFTAETGAAIQVNVFGSNEEMLAKLQAGGSGWDVFVPTNYTSSSRWTSPSCRTTTPRALTSVSQGRAQWTAKYMPCRRTGAPRALR
jgi:spermidine/putrescine transport system substrate-binding protein